MTEREIPVGIITDHDHEYEQIGAFRTASCKRCGARTSAHLSWGKSLAEKLGGDPLDYVQPR